MSDMTHCIVHDARSESPPVKELCELHLRHRFQDDPRGSGVSAPYRDHVFGAALRSRREADG